MYDSVGPPADGTKVQFNSVTEPTTKLVVEPRHCSAPASTRSCAQPVYVGTISTTVSAMEERRSILRASPRIEHAFSLSRIARSFGPLAPACASDRRCRQGPASAAASGTFAPRPSDSAVARLARAAAIEQADDLGRRRADRRIAETGRLCSHRQHSRQACRPRIVGSTSTPVAQCSARSPVVEPDTLPSSARCAVSKTRDHRPPSPFRSSDATANSTDQGDDAGSAAERHTHVQHRQ